MSEAQMAKTDSLDDLAAIIGWEQVARIWAQALLEVTAERDALKAEAAKRSPVPLSHSESVKL